MQKIFLAIMMMAVLGCCSLIPKPVMDVIDRVELKGKMIVEDKGAVSFGVDLGIHFRPRENVAPREAKPGDATPSPDAKEGDDEGAKGTKNKDDSDKADDKIGGGAKASPAEASLPAPPGFLDAEQRAIHALVVETAMTHEIDPDDFRAAALTFAGCASLTTTCQVGGEYEGRAPSINVACSVTLSPPAPRAHAMPTAAPQASRPVGATTAPEPSTAVPPPSAPSPTPATTDRRAPALDAAQSAILDLAVAAAVRAGLNPADFVAAGWIESRLRADAKNPRSTASGVYQFLASTARQYGLTDPFDAQANIAAATRLWLDNRRHLTATLGRVPTGGELYLAHVHGAAGATALLKGGASPSVGLVGSDAIALNNFAGGDPGAVTAEAHIRALLARFTAAREAFARRLS